MLKLKNTKKIKTNIIKNDRVIVISGNYKGTIGIVLEINNLKNLVKIQGVNMRTHYDKKDETNSGGLNKREGWIHLSNVNHVTQDGKPTKVKRVRTDTGVKIFAKKNNEDLRLKSDLLKSAKVTLEETKATKEAKKVKKVKFTEENKEKDISFYEDDKNLKSSKKGKK